MANEVDWFRLICFMTIYINKSGLTFMRLHACSKAGYLSPGLTKNVKAIINLEVFFHNFIF
jgi:hypothetical protein